MELLVGWWVVEKPVKNQGQKPKDVTHEVAPAPLGHGVAVQGPGDDGTKDSKGEGGKEDERHHRPPPLIRDEFAEDDAEGELACRRYAVADVGCDEGLDVLGAGADDAPRQSEYRGTQHQPAAAVHVGEATKKKKADGAAHGPESGNPGDVRGRSNIGVDEATARGQYHHWRVQKRRAYRVLAGSTHPR
jgi:hypothetical protein